LVCVAAASALAGCFGCGALAGRRRAAKRLPTAEAIAWTDPTPAAVVVAAVAMPAVAIGPEKEKDAVKKSAGPAEMIEIEIEMKPLYI
jgi:hypothetical protein